MSPKEEETDSWESRGRKLKRTTSVGSMVIATPQLVTGLLPENGGGLAIAVSASENHTAVLTGKSVHRTFDAHTYFSLRRMPILNTHLISLFFEQILSRFRAFVHMGCQREE